MKNDTDKINDNLKEYLLPIGFIKNGYIKQNSKPGKYKYEDYLRELINKTSYFMEKTEGIPFEPPKSEAHGENDACSKHYNIDFKLICGTSIPYVKTLTSQQINEHIRGAVSYGISKGKGEFLATWLHKDLRGKNKEELLRIKNIAVDKKNILGTNKIDKVDDLVTIDIHDFLNSIDKEKNLLLFFPLILWVDSDEECSEQTLCDIIYNDFRIPLEIRLELNPEYDTFIIYLHKGYFVISKYNGHGLSYIDHIPYSEVESFMKIADYYYLDANVQRFIYRV